jgi:hypothetical protein
LQFSTGARRLPAGGFAYLHGSEGLQRFNIALILRDGDERYPKFHTCFNTIDLPIYSSKEVLVERFTVALSDSRSEVFSIE